MGVHEITPTLEHTDVIASSSDQTQYMLTATHNMTQHWQPPYSHVQTISFTTGPAEPKSVHIIMHTAHQNAEARINDSVWLVTASPQTIK